MDADAEDAQHDGRGLVDAEAEAPSTMAARLAEAGGACTPAHLSLLFSQTLLSRRIGVGHQMFWYCEKKLSLTLLQTSLRA